MIFPQLAEFTDVALLLLRIMVGIVFLTSGFRHARDPEARGNDIGMSKGFTMFLGLAEVAAGLGVISGLFAQLAAIGLILIMLGAIQKKSLFGTPVFGAVREQMAGATKPCLS
jgi:putative oxidoreductase